MLDFLCAEAGFDPQLAKRMRNWQHSGFSVHNQIRVRAADVAGRKQLARFHVRTPFALEKMTYDRNTGMVLYRSKLHATLKRNFQLLPAAQWLTLLLAHIPDKYEHLVRYYGWYRNRARGERNTDASAANTATTLHLDETRADRTTCANWARLIQKVYEVDPLECPQCGHTMRLIAVIDDSTVIRRIRKPLRLWDPHPQEPDHPARDPPSATAPGVALPPASLQSWPAHTTLPLTYPPVPDSA